MHSFKWVAGLACCVLQRRGETEAGRSRPRELSREVLRLHDLGPQINLPKSRSRAAGCLMNCQASEDIGEPFGNQNHLEIHSLATLRSAHLDGSVSRGPRQRARREARELEAAELGKSSSVNSLHITVDLATALA